MSSSASKLREKRLSELNADATPDGRVSHLEAELLIGVLPL